jgi:hypothetical protein
MTSPSSNSKFPLWSTCDNNNLPKAEATTIQIQVQVLPKPAYPRRLAIQVPSTHPTASNLPTILVVAEEGAALDQAEEASAVY